MSHKKKFGFGLILGTLAGLVAGLLTAPKSGKETRDDIKRKATDMKNQAMGHVEDVKDKAMDVADDARSRAEELKTRAEQAVEGAKAGFNKNPKR